MNITTDTCTVIHCKRCQQNAMTGDPTRIWPSTTIPYSIDSRLSEKTCLVWLLVSFHLYVSLSLSLCVSVSLCLCLTVYLSHSSSVLLCLCLFVLLYMFLCVGICRSRQTMHGNMWLKLHCCTKLTLYASWSLWQAKNFPLDMLWWGCPSSKSFTADLSTVNIV